MHFSIFSDTHFMREALKEAQKAYQMGEIPVGAVIVSDNRILARGHNLTEQLHDVTAHAELLAVTAAADSLGNKYLPNCTLYVTLEPCAMCAGVLFWAQIDKIVYGASDPKRGALRFSPTLFHPKTTIIGGVLAEECADLMKNFFLEKR
jgi:tRNA(adenine34) deaminase